MKSLSMKRLLLLLLLVLAISIGSLLMPFMQNPMTLAQTNTFCAANLTCTVTAAWSFITLNKIQFADQYASVQAAMNALPSTGGTIYIAPGTYVGPTAPTNGFSNVSFVCLSSGGSQQMTGNFGTSPNNTTTQCIFTYASTLTLTSVQNMRMQNIELDFGQHAAGLVLNSSSFNEFSHVTINQAGSTSVAALQLTTSAASGAGINSVRNTFDHLDIICNNAANQNCNQAIQLLGRGVVNSGTFATLNRFTDVTVNGIYRLCVDAELNSDTNYFWHITCNESSAAPANSAVLAFNEITPASDQDADGGIYQGVIQAGNAPTTFIRAGQTIGNQITISQGSAGQPSLTVVAGAGPILYSVQNIGLPGVTPDLYLGGRLSAVGAMGANQPAGNQAGDIMLERTSTTGVLWIGTDGGNLNRTGTQLLLDGAHIAGLGLTEQGANPCSTGVDLIFGNAGTHQMDLCNNSTTFFPVAQAITATSAAFATATTAGTCVQNTTAVTGATTSMAVSVAPVSTPGVGAQWSGFVSSAGNVTINECAVATSAGGTIAFNIRVIP